MKPKIFIIFRLSQSYSYIILVGDVKTVISILTPLRAGKLLNYSDILEGLYKKIKCFFFCRERVKMYNMYIQLRTN